MRLKIKNYSFIVALAGLSLLTGCSVSPKKYDNSHSKAYNLGDWGGIDVVGMDQHLPEETYRSISTAVDTASNTALFMSSAGLGLKALSGLGLGFATTVLSPNKSYSRNSLFAWMPSDMANNEDEARSILLGNVRNALEKSLKKMNTKYHVVYSDLDDGYITYSIINDNWFCSKDQDCKITIYLKPASYISMSPLALLNEEYNSASYQFSSSSLTDYSKISIRNADDSKIPEDILYQNLSSNLPYWAFLYQAPKKVKLKNGDTIPFPYILHNGNINLFITPKS